jgi:light-regulated signal transduction histidine kinase (bacteriophytochrome)
VDVVLMIEDCLKPIPVPDGIRVEILNELFDPAADLDRDQILQVFNNLVSNAITAMPEGGKLTIRLGRSGDRVVIRVSDSGIGISRENARRLSRHDHDSREPAWLAITYARQMYRATSPHSNADPTPAAGSFDFFCQRARNRVGGHDDRGCRLC